MMYYPSLIAFRPRRAANDNAQWLQCPAAAWAKLTALHRQLLETDVAAYSLPELHTHWQAFLEVSETLATWPLART